MLVLLVKLQKFAFMIEYLTNLATSSAKWLSLQSTAAVTAARGQITLIYEYYYTWELQKEK